MPASDTMDDQLPKHSCIGIIVLATAFLVYFSLGFLVSEAAHASSTPAESDHFCAFDDLEARERDHLHPASKRPANLNVGEPRTVRMIYFLPNDRPFRQEVVDEMKAVIRHVQTFYAEQMRAHGYGDKTFRIETDARGEPMVHRQDAPHPYNHYVSSTSTVGTIVREIDRTFDLDANIYLIVLGTVGFGDFVLFAAEFGLSDDDEGFDARFDLDGNGAVGFSDFVIFAGAFGKS